MSLAPGSSFVFGEVSCDLDGSRQDARALPKGTSVLGPVRADGSRVVEADDDRGTISDDVGGEGTGVGVPSKAEESKFEADGFAADGGLWGIMRSLCSHAQSSAVRELLVCCPGCSGEFRVLNMSGGPVGVDGDARLEGDVLFLDSSAVAIGDDAIVGIKAGRDLDGG
jgi:hypothetical protein